MAETMDAQLARFVLDKAREVDQAKLFENTTQRPFHFYQIVYALDTATKAGQEIKIGFPFKGITVRQATDSTCSVNIRIGAQDAINPDIQLRQNDAINFDEPINEAYLSWSAQTGKSITLLFAIDAVLNIGVATTAITGGIFQQDGTAAAAIASVTLSAATAAAIAPALSTRKTCTLVNNTGATIYLGGDSTVTADTTATGGIPVPAGSTFLWRNTAALYAISTPGGIVNRLEET
jgi:hypothetical protein